MKPAREEEEARVMKRPIRFIAAPLMLALAACAGAADSRTDLSAGYPDAQVEPNAVQGEPLQASWPGSPFPVLSYEDREAIGRVTYAEAGNQGEEGLAAVIFTILNRVNSGQFGKQRAGRHRRAEPVRARHSRRRLAVFAAAGSDPERSVRDHPPPNSGRLASGSNERACSSRTRGSSPRGRQRRSLVLPRRFWRHAAGGRDWRSPLL